MASQLGAGPKSWCATASTWTGRLLNAWKTPTSSSPSGAQAALATRERELAQARSKLVQQGSLIAASTADVNASQAVALGRAQIDLNRAEALPQATFRGTGHHPLPPTTVALALPTGQGRAPTSRHQRVQRDTLGISRHGAQIASARNLAQAEINLSRT